MKYLFIIQNENFDFCYELKNACDFHNWFCGIKEYSFKIVDTIPTKETVMDIETKNDVNISNIIPIGSVEFVQSYYRNIINITYIPPVNIPKELMKKEYTGRNFYEYDKNKKCYISVFDSNNTILTNSDKTFFIKEKKIKGFSDICRIKDIDKKILGAVPLYENFTLSEYLPNIISEYRCFVYRNQLLDCKNYSGSFEVLPDFNIIREMISKYNNPAYTLDVGILDNGKTICIECHDFFSCGLYGFYDYEKMLHMLISTHKKNIKR